MKTKIIAMILITALVIFSSAAVYVYSTLGKIQRVSIPDSNKELASGDTAYNEDTGETDDIQNTEKEPGYEESLPQSDGEIDSAIVDKISRSGIVNIVFLGLDRRESGVNSRSDTIMVVSIDAKNDKIKITSLMRDMYVPIPGRTSNRINAAYVFGGPALAIKTINSNFGLNIKDYVTVDFFGLEKIIDKVGGVDINVSAAEAEVLNDYLRGLNKLNGDKVTEVKEGYQKLNGRQTVAYCRIRYVGNADYERTERQRRVLNDLFKKIKAQGILKLPGIISAFLPYVETSLSDKEIIALAYSAARLKADRLEEFRLPINGYFKSRMIRGMAVLVPDIDANKKRLQEFIYGEN